MFYKLSKLKRIIILFLFLTIISLISCKPNLKKIKSSKLNTLLKDTIIYFKSNDIYSDNWEKADKNTGNIIRKYEIINDSTYYVKNYVVGFDKILSKGKLKNVFEANAKDAGYFGDWFYYGDGDIGLYKIGKFKEGLKNEIWYIIYEDAIPELFYYKNGKKIEYNDSIRVFDDSSKLIMKCKGTSKSGLPKGKAIFFFSNVISEREFIDKEDKILVKYYNYKALNREFIEEGEFEEKK